MLVFRQVDEPYPDKEVHWNVEFFSDDPPEVGFPVGFAFFVVVQGTAQLNYILVADQWRKRGIAKELIRGCRKRWPNMQFTSAMGPEGEALLRSVGAYFDDD